MFTKSVRFQVDNIWKPAKEELIPEEEPGEKDDQIEIDSALIEMMSGNILSGCGSGTWDMWGPCKSSPEESLTGSYWSKEEEESLDTSVSRILSMLKQPSLKRLEALANRLAPIMTMKSSALAASSMAFKKPLHLVKEFVPRSERNKTSVSAAAAAVRSINLIYPPGLMSGTVNLTGVHLKPIPLIQTSSQMLGVPPTLVGRPVQRPFPVYHVPAQNFNTHIPPLPKELVHETPPNLSTIKVLSQLFNTY